MERKSVTVNVRFPNDLHQEIAALAEAEDRSLNGEIVHAVRQYVAGRRQQSGLLRCAEPAGPYATDSADSAGN
jgi:predicted transcriptional regulator